MDYELPCPLAFNWVESMGEPGRTLKKERRASSWYLYSWLLSCRGHVQMNSWAEGLVRQSFPHCYLWLQFQVTITFTHGPPNPRSTGSKGVLRSLALVSFLYLPRTYVNSSWWDIMPSYLHLQIRNWYSEKWDKFSQATEETNVKTQI